MLKKFVFISISALLILPIVSSVSNATILVPSYGETGWQTYFHTFEEAWSGSVGVGVSDYGDTSVESYLLLDNLVNMGPASNQGFETGFTGYTVDGSGASVGSSAISEGGTTYTPTEGSLMAILSSVNGDSGFSTSTFGGTDGTVIVFEVDAGLGDTVSFDWNFFTTDYVPFYDFAFLYVVDPQEGIVHFEKLAQIAAVPVPEPPMLLLLGAGLFAFGVYGRRRFKK